MHEREYACTCVHVYMINKYLTKYLSSYNSVKKSLLTLSLKPSGCHSELKEEQKLGGMR